MVAVGPTFALEYALADFLLRSWNLGLVGEGVCTQSHVSLVPQKQIT